MCSSDEKGHPTRIPFDNGGYMDAAPRDRGENIRREICLIVEEMGLDPHKSYHQIGPGQNEIDFHCADALSAADDASLFRWVVETCAAGNGLAADFSPCPLENCPGSALHIQVRLIEARQTREMLFFRTPCSPTRSPVILQSLRAILQKTVSSYSALSCQLVIDQTKRHASQTAFRR